MSIFRVFFHFLTKVLINSIEKQPVKDNKKNVRIADAEQEEEDRENNNL